MLMTAHEMSTAGEKETTLVINIMLKTAVLYYTPGD